MGALKKIWQRHPVKIALVYVLLSTAGMLKIYLSALDSVSWFGIMVVMSIVWTCGLYLVPIAALFERGIVRKRRKL
jgi:hypothetical protein